jgi:FlaA1/EpsC-like NDP-sugar epimerase
MAGENQLADRLAVYRDALENAAPRAAEQPTRSDYESFLTDQPFKGKRVMIWGTGSNYRNCWADWLSEYYQDIKFIGFVDNDPQRWDTTLDGHPVYDPDTLDAGLNPDYVIIASQIVWRQDIIKQCRAMGWSKSHFI